MSSHTHGVPNQNNLSKRLKWAIEVCPVLYISNHLKLYDEEQTEILSPLLYSFIYIFKYIVSRFPVYSKYWSIPLTNLLYDFIYRIDEVVIQTTLLCFLSFLERTWVTEFVTTWEWVNNKRIFIFGWTISFKIIITPLHSWTIFPLDTEVKISPRHKPVCPPITHFHTLNAHDFHRNEAAFVIETVAALLLTGDCVSVYVSVLCVLMTHTSFICSLHLIPALLAQEQITDSRCDESRAGEPDPHTHTHTSASHFDRTVQPFSHCSVCSELPSLLWLLSPTQNISVFDGKHLQGEFHDFCACVFPGWADPAAGGGSVQAEISA